MACIDPRMVTGNRKKILENIAKNLSTFRETKHSFNTRLNAELQQLTYVLSSSSNRKDIGGSCTERFENGIKLQDMDEDVNADVDMDMHVDIDVDT